MESSRVERIVESLAKPRVESRTEIRLESSVEARVEFRVGNPLEVETRAYPVSVKANCLAELIHFVTSSSKRSFSLASRL